MKKRIVSRTKPTGEREDNESHLASAIDKFMLKPESMSDELASRVLVLADLLMTKGRRRLELNGPELMLLRRIRSNYYTGYPNYRGVQDIYDHMALPILERERYCQADKSGALRLTEKGARYLGDLDGDYER